jgi:hypothetical protein
MLISFEAHCVLNETSSISRKIQSLENGGHGQLYEPYCDVTITDRQKVRTARLDFKSNGSNVYDAGRVRTRKVWVVPAVACLLGCGC